MCGVKLLEYILQKMYTISVGHMKNKMMLVDEWSK